MTVRIINGDCRTALADFADDSVQCCVTSPPYFGLRDYGVEGQIGLEQTPDAYVAQMVAVFREVRRVLRDDGTLWLNLGDSYAGSWGAQSRGAGTVTSLSSGQIAAHPKGQTNTGTIRQAGLKPKDLMMIPARVALALQMDGWWLRSKIIWAKPNGMPGSQEDRPTSSYEEIFLMTKAETYWSDFDAIKTPPRESTLIRTAQDVQSQAGSHRANGGGKTNGPMKAVGGVDKQRGHFRRHAGFNDRWDAMEKADQQSKPAMIRDVWFVPPIGCDLAHFAVMPEEIARRCIQAGSKPGDTVLDPFGGAGTTGLVADRLGRNAILVELNPNNAEIMRDRIRNDCPMFASVA